MKTCIITGSSSGIGLATALTLAQNNCRVIVLSRNEEKCRAALTRINEVSRRKDNMFLSVDLSSQAAVKNVCREIKENLDIIDVLINNASCVSSEFVLTNDNVELQFAVNHVAPFMLSHYLLPQLSRSKQGRIINVNSRAHARATINWDDIYFSKKYNLTKCYNQSKLANMYFTYTLAEKLKDTSITVNAFHPGLVNTDFGEKNTSQFHALAWKLMKVLGRKPEIAAQDAAYLALQPDLNLISGKYFHNKKQIQSSDLSYNFDFAQKIWDLTCNISGIKSQEYNRL